MKQSIDVFWHDDVLLHDTGFGVFEAPASDLIEVQMQHPESNPRLLNMRRILKRGPVAEFVNWHEGRHASEDEVLRFHTQDYLREILDADQTGKRFSIHTLMSAGSLQALLAAAGTAIASTEHALTTGRPALALIRPPGHHAAPSVADGYCFFNNVALAAKAARAAGLAKVAIIDWDVHHGNGTQEGFYEDPSVFTVSLHMDHGSWGPTHPQTGAANETGRGVGTGFNLNVPFPFGAGDGLYKQCFDQFVVPAVRNFQPDLILVSNGQDASQYDPNGRQLVSMVGFNALARRAADLANELCGGKIVIIQEGGYNPAYSAYCLHAAVEGFIGKRSSIEDPLSYIVESDKRIETDLKSIRLDLKAAGWTF